MPKPAPNDIEASEDQNQAKNSETRFALEHSAVGRITGYAEVYRELLTGKSDELGRSHGFFVYVLGRLINIEDGHFGISPDELRHGTFGRIRVVAHMDGLDEYLKSDRERIREGPVLNDAQNILRAIFNKIRPELEKADAEDDPGAKLARKLAGSPASVSRRPIVDLAMAVIDGKAKSKYVAVPPSLSPSERSTLVAGLESRLESPETFVTGVELRDIVESCVLMKRGERRRILLRCVFFNRPRGAKRIRHHASEDEDWSPRARFPRGVDLGANRPRSVGLPRGVRRSQSAG